MPEPENKATPNPGEGDTQAGKAPSVDTEKYVPKDQYTADLSAKTTELQSLQKSLEEAQSSLTSPEYLKYLADKRAGDKAKRPDNAPASDKELRDRLASLEVVASQLAATIELTDVERKYADFKDFRSDVQAIINVNGNLSFEQAYLMAKGKKGQAPSSTTPPTGDKKVTGTEKPGQFVPDSAHSEKEFKTTADATADVLRSMREKYGITDTL
jgi:hypothetical protein